MKKSWISESVFEVITIYRWSQKLHNHRSSGQLMSSIPMGLFSTYYYLCTYYNFKKFHRLFTYYWQKNSFLFNNILRIITRKDLKFFTDILLILLAVMTKSIISLCAYLPPYLSLYFLWTPYLISEGNIKNSIRYKMCTRSRKNGKLM